MAKRTWFGIPKLKRKVKKLTDVFDHDETVEILMQGGFVYERGAKQRIRARGLIDTGLMRNSTIAEPDPTDRKPAVLIGPKVHYAIYHEFGTRHMRARPLMRPTFDEDKQKALAAVRDEAHRRVMKAVK